ncbi:hypothetical protein [Pseudomonas glycinae]|uniref:Uncharacterized protein n=1 Tax=Pseudomonas glycinae TaxID=1785145 RepID=A0ABM5ZLS0_9PSED|nr:hypothetical protein [Pseudomonas glycinae]AMQ84614.1 hypothetical protein AWU82_15245 [Pseudomonas glycinae]
MAIAKITGLPKEVADTEIEEKFRKRHPQLLFALRRSDDRTSAEIEYSVQQPKLAQKKFVIDEFLLQSEFPWENLAR